MNRRANIFALVVLGGAAVAWPFAGRAQQQRLPVIGYLDSSGLPRWFEAFQNGLVDQSYVLGRTIAVELRSAVGEASRLPALAAELVRLQPRVIVASGSAAAAAAKNATATIPIVFAFSTDPVALGLVASLARPGGNVTGLSNQAPGLVGKRLQLLAEVLPGVSHIGIVQGPGTTGVDFPEIQAAAVKLRLTLDSFEVPQPDDIDAVFKKAAERTGGVAVLSGPLIFAHRARAAAAAARHKVPAIYYDEAYTESGGLVSYGPSLRGLHRNAAVLVDKILKGAKPSDLPVEQPTKFELIVNLRSARALGLKIPQSVLVRADQIIE